MPRLAPAPPMLGVADRDRQRVGGVGRVAVEAGSSILTIIATCRFSAWPTPTIVFLMRLAAYSATGRPIRAKVASATPRAWPSFSADCGSRLTKVSSTAASCGRSALDQPGQPAMDRRQPLGERGRGIGLDRAAADEDQPRPATSITPQPSCAGRDRRRGCESRRCSWKRLIYEIARQRILRSRVDVVSIHRLLVRTGQRDAPLHRHFRISPWLARRALR